MSLTPSAAVMSSGAASFGPIRPTPSSGQFRGHIGDVPIHILERILVDSLLEDGGLDAVKNFAVALLAKDEAATTMSYICSQFAASAK